MRSQHNRGLSGLCRAWGLGICNGKPQVIHWVLYGGGVVFTASALPSLSVRSILSVWMFSVFPQNYKILDSYYHYHNDIKERKQ